MVQAKAQQLFPPAITYNTNEVTRIEPGADGRFPARGPGAWRFDREDGRRFILPVWLAGG
jgi:hypothetical protein